MNPLIRAKVWLIGVGLVWLSLILLMSPFQVPLTVGAVWIKAWKSYRYSFWIWQDQGVNVIMTGGNPDVTVSSKIGYMAEQGSKTAQYMARFVDWVFYVTIKQRNHCRASIEYDEEHY